MQKNFIMYGMGKDQDDIRHLCRQIVAQSGGGILYECDRNPQLWSDEKAIYPPEKILENPEATVIVGCEAKRQAMDALRKMGCKNEFVGYPWFSLHFLFDDIIYSDSMTNTEYVNSWFVSNKSELLGIYDTTDEETKKFWKR